MYAATAAGSNGHEFETQRGIPQLSQTQFSFIVIVKIVKNPNKIFKNKYIGREIKENKVGQVVKTIVFNIKKKKNLKLKQQQN